MRYVVVIWLLVGLGFSVQSQEDPTQWERQYYSQPRSEEPGFDRGKWQEIREGLDYEEAKKEEQQEEQAATEDTAPSSDGWSFTIPGAEYIMYGLGIAAIGLILYYLVFKNLNRAGRKVKKKKATLQEVEEDLEDADVDPLLSDAVKQGNYRLAVRLYYLKCIQSLAAGHFIKWEKDKTNGEYLREMTDATLRPDFRVLTRQFEQIWYGEYAIDQSAFESLEAQFKAFLAMIDNHQNRAA